VNGTEYRISSPRRNSVYGFRVAAVNDGGESMPSEEVAAGVAAPDGRPAGSPRSVAHALIVAGFDRVAAPERVVLDGFSGFAGFLDEGMADGEDISYVGDQYDFDPDSPWLDDDSPGHGASYSTYETRVLTGNTFDYAGVHGAEFLRAGWSFSTVSDEVFQACCEPSADSTDVADAGSSSADSMEVADAGAPSADSTEVADAGAPSGARWTADRYPIIDVLLGEEKTTRGPGETTAFEAVPPAMRTALTGYAASGGRILISGAHFATDLAGPAAGEDGRAFARDILGFVWRTDHAVERGEVFTLDEPVPASGDDRKGTSDRPADGAPALAAPPLVEFNTDPVADVYRVESPDAIEPAPGSMTLMRYADNGMSAAVGRSRAGVDSIVAGAPAAVIAFGFPLETVLDAETRTGLFRAAIGYLFADD
jgi:hypothetical protein